MKKNLCENCKGVGFIDVITRDGVHSRSCEVCKGTGVVDVPPTHYETIISASVDELAEMIVEHNYGLVMEIVTGIFGDMSAKEFEIMKTIGKEGLVNIMEKFVDREAGKAKIKKFLESNAEETT